MGRGSVPSDAVFYIVSVAPVAMRLPVLGVEIIGGIPMVHSTLFFFHRIQHKAFGLAVVGVYKAASHSP